MDLRGCDETSGYGIKFSICEVPQVTGLSQALALGRVSPKSLDSRHERKRNVLKLNDTFNKSCDPLHILLDVLEYF